MATDTSRISSTYDFASMAALKKGATGSLSERKTLVEKLQKSLRLNSFGL